ncbi:ABC transporter ATP-binding protein [Methylobacterium sp. D54C]
MMHDGSAGLAIADLRVGYGRHAVLRGVTLPMIQPGRLTIVAGPNGAGKSTLLRALAGLVQAAGSIRLDGREMVGAPASRRAEGVAFMPQALPPDLTFTVMEAVVYAARAGKPAHGAPAPVQAAAVLDRLGLTALARTRLDRLSGGQRQLTSLAQALVRRPRLLLLDEPLSALDLRHQHAVLTVLRSLAADGLIVLAVLHDLSLAATWADRVVLIHGGGVAADGPPERAVTAATLAEVYGVAATVRRGDDRSTSIVVTGLLDP